MITSNRLRNKLNELSKDDLIDIISSYHTVDCSISELLVDVSKQHITKDSCIGGIIEVLRHNDTTNKINKL